jgi:hypothetical protein
MSQPLNQNTPYPNNQPSQTMHTYNQNNQPPYPPGSTSTSAYTSSYASNNPLPNNSNYAPYSLPQTTQSPPSQGLCQYE